MDQFESLKTNKGEEINGPILIKPKVFTDERGFFYESWNKDNFNKILNKSNIDFVQDNHSKSSLGVLRGLHYQLPPYSQGKLIRVVKGEIYDVIVDLRKESKTFTKWAGIKINSDIKNQLWIPNGFAHGFLTLSKEAIVGYRVTNFWAKDFERTLYWKDPDINISWPIKEKNFIPKLSAKDQQGNIFKELFEKGDLF